MFQFPPCALGANASWHMLLVSSFAVLPPQADAQSHRPSAMFVLIWQNWKIGFKQDFLLDVHRYIESNISHCYSIWLSVFPIKLMR